jgi:hypothetical protein
VAKAEMEKSPFETRELRASLKNFLGQKYVDPAAGKTSAIGSFKWGVYIFYDYDGEPIYVGRQRKKSRAGLDGI